MSGIMCFTINSSDNIFTRITKKYPGYHSVCLIDSEEKRVKALKQFDIGDVWGIGRRHTKRLTALGVRTAYDFTQLPQAYVRKNMTVVGERTWSELLGTPCIHMEAVAPAKQSIMVSRSFGKMIEDYIPISEAVATYANMAAAKLRRQKSCAKAMLVFVDSNPFREDLEQYSRHIVMNLLVATNSSQELIRYALEGLQKIYRKGIHYKKAGVMLMDICSDSIIQGNLFDTIDRKKHHNLMVVMDRVNDYYGRHTLKIAAMGDGKAWKIKQERLSPCYSTRMADFPHTV